VRLLAVVLFLLVLCGCPNTGGAGLRARQDSMAQQEGGSETRPTTSAWLDPDAKVNSAIRLTSPAGIDVRQAAYWQPMSADGKQATMSVLLRTRDYTAKAEEGTPDPERVAKLDLLTGETSKFDEGMTGLPLELSVSPNHKFALIAQLESLGDKKGYSLEAVDLRAYGYGDKPVELRPQPSVVPWQVQDDGNGLCRIVRGIVVEKGLPAVGYDWSSGTQLCNVAAKSFATAEEPAAPGPARLRSGYSVSYDPALPDKGSITYWLGNGGRSTQRWNMAYFGQSAPFDWRPPVRWLDNDSVATVTFLPRALGGSSGLFRIVALEADGAAKLIEDRATPDVSLVTADGVLLYAMRGGTALWSVWAASSDGMRKQRVWAADSTVFLEVLDVSGGRRVLVHRQYFGGDNALHSDIMELSLDPLQATKGKPEPEEIKALPTPKGIIEEDKPAPKKKAEEPPPSDDDLFPSDSGDGGFIPDSPGGGPPPISGE
jgi:hypothetical protein